MRTTRNLAAAVSLATGVLLAGCTPGDTGGSEQDAAPSGQAKQQNALADLDPCNVFSEQELTKLGVEDPPEPVDQGTGESGCDYDSDDFGMTVVKGADQDKKFWDQRQNNFAVFDENKVGEHDGIKQVTDASRGTGLCNQAIMAGKGTVTVNVSLDGDAEDSAACSKAMEIAKKIEPKLPA